MNMYSLFTSGPENLNLTAHLMPLSSRNDERYTTGNPKIEFSDWLCQLIDSRYIF